MPEDNKPFLPRSSESGEEDELRQETELIPEAEEQQLQANNDAFEQKVIYSNCQIECSAEDTFCRECGNYLNIRKQTSASPAQPTPPKPVHIKKPLDTSERVDLFWGRFAEPVSRRLPPPLDKLNEGQEIVIFKKIIFRDEDILLFFSHPVLNPADRYNYGLKPLRAVQRDGEYFLLLTNQIGPIDDPPLEDFDYPPPAIVKVDSKAKALKILSQQTFLEIVAVMQKENDERADLPFKDTRILDEQVLREALFPGINKLTDNLPDILLKDAPVDDIHTTDYGPPPITLPPEDAAVTVRQITVSGKRILWGKIARILNLMADEPNAKIDPDGSVVHFDGGRRQVMTGLTSFEFTDGTRAHYGFSTPWEPAALTIELAAGEKISIEISPAEKEPGRSTNTDELSKTVELIECPQCKNLKTLEERFCRECGMETEDN